MSKPKTDSNNKIVYMRDVLEMSFLEISMAQTMAGRHLTESRVARIYAREKKKAAQQFEEAENER